MVNGSGKREEKCCRKNIKSVESTNVLRCVYEGWEVNKMRSKEMETSRNEKRRKKIPSLNNSFSHPNWSCLAFYCCCVLSHLLLHDNYQNWFFFSLKNIKWAHWRISVPLFSFGSCACSWKKKFYWNVEAGSRQNFIDSHVELIASDLSRSRDLCKNLWKKGS